jgi:hypothetical protein
MAERIFQANRVDVAVGPQVLGADTTVSSGWFSMREWAELAVVLVLKGTLVAGETITLALRQATSAAGGGAKALASKVVTAGAAAGQLLMSFDPVRRAVITLDTVIASDAVTLNGETTLTVSGSVHTITLDTVVVGDAVTVDGTTKTFRETSVHTATLSGVGAEDAITVNGSTFTFVIEDAGAGEVLKGASDTEAATNLAAAVDALAGVTATAADAVVTIKGTAAAATVATEDASITVAAVSAGANDVLMGATDAACATNLATAIDALSGITASADGAVVSVVKAASAATITTSDTTITIAEAAFSGTSVAVGSDDDETAENLAAAISAVEGFTATAAGAVVTVVGADVEAETSDATITLLHSAVADGDEIVVNGVTLEFVAEGSGDEGAAAEGEVLLGDDDDDAAANLAAAISAISGLAAVATDAAGESPSSVAVAASVPAGVTVDGGDTTIIAGTTEDLVLLARDVDALDTNAGFAFVQVQVTASGAGLTGAATLLRGGGRVAVRQDV